MHAVEAFELALGLLALIIALYWLALKLRLPPSAALLVGGGALAFLPGLPAISLDPALALVLFLPPLLMDGAYTTPLVRFRRHLPGILSLAIGAVVFTTLTIGVVTHWLVPELPWAACFALGAIVSPPDAVSARAVLKGVTLPRRLTALLEGESLLNDATGLILFRCAVAAALSGVFDAGDTVRDFAILAIGGVFAGLVIGATWVFVAKYLRDETLVVVTSTLLGWAAYLAGEALHVSGVLTTVTAGLVAGWYQHVIFSAQTRLVGHAFWRIMVFALEAMVFILIGLSLRGTIERMGGIEAVPASMVWAVLGVVLAVALSPLRLGFRVGRRSGNRPQGRMEARSAARLAAGDGAQLDRDARGGDAGRCPGPSRRHARARPHAGLRVFGDLRDRRRARDQPGVAHSNGSARRQRTARKNGHGGDRSRHGARQDGDDRETRLCGRRHADPPHASQRGSAADGIHGALREKTPTPPWRNCARISTSCFRLSRPPGKN
jgi:NhaP-type Na+/H+ or K+/H+ antiporter